MGAFSEFSHGGVVDDAEVRLRIVVAGQGDLPPQDRLENALCGRVFDLPVTLEVVPQQRTTFETKQSGG